MTTTGSAMPSLSPLSTFNAWRIRTGTRLLETTAWPSAASVGARMAASTAACQKLNPSNIQTANTVPKAIVKGMPIASILTGKPCSLRRSRRSIRAASLKRTRTRVSSARSSKNPPSTSTCSSPSQACPVSNPQPTKKMGGVSGVFSILFEIRPKAMMLRAMTTSTVACIRSFPALFAGEDSGLGAARPPVQVVPSNDV